MADEKRKYDEIDLKSLARAYTPASIKALGGWATGDLIDPDIRIKAIKILLERGWGKPAQPHVGVDGESGIEITMRNIVEGKP